MNWFVVERNDGHFVISDDQLEAFSVLPEEQATPYKSKMAAQQALVAIVQSRIAETQKKLTVHAKKRR